MTDTSRLSTEQIAEAREFAEFHGIGVDALLRVVEKCCIEIGAAFDVIMQAFRSGANKAIEVRLVAKDLQAIMLDEPNHIQPRRNSEPWRRQGKRRGAPRR